MTMLLCQLMLTAVSACQPSPDYPIEMAVDAILSSYIGNDIPGATIGIIKDGKLVFKKGMEWQMCIIQSLIAKTLFTTLHPGVNNLPLRLWRR